MIYLECFFSPEKESKVIFIRYLHEVPKVTCVMSPCSEFYL